MPMAAWLTSILLISTAFFHITIAQSFREDSTFLHEAQMHAIDLYTKNMGAQSHLYNGSEYIEYNSIAGEHPYYEAGWSDGVVFYDGEQYEHTPLLFDLSSDKVITENSNGRPLQLISGKIKYFILNGHTFVFLPEATVKEGFYDLLYNGEIKVYARRKKTLQKNISGTELEIKFKETVRYYIRKKENYILIRNKRDAFSALLDQKSELKRFARENHLRFKPNLELALTRMAQFYDQIPKQP